MHGQTCDCLSCRDRITVPANGERQIYNVAPCLTGKAAAVSSIKVQSTDGSGFLVHTMDDPSDTTYYTAGSTSSIVTCFNMRRGFTVGGRKSRIYVVIKCISLFKPCSLEYSISLSCVNVATASTSRSTIVSTAKPVRPSTVVPTRVVDICECHCCKGSATCAPKHIGTVFYYTNTCQASDCASRCSTLFSTCPVNGSQPGKIQTYCKSNTGMALRNVFYIPLLTLLIYTCCAYLT